MVDFSSMPLGKLPATVDDRTLKAERYIVPEALPPIPTVIDYARRVAQWRMYLNNLLGCCVISAMAHQEDADSAENGSPVTITDADVLAGYEACGGYVQGNPATDRGTDPLVALNWWRQTGIAGNKIGAFVSVNPRDEALVAAALYLFGGLFVGLELPKSAQTQTVWDVVGDGQSGDAAPSSWGGHMIYIPAREAPGRYANITWGERLSITQRFIATYSPNETFAVIPDAWLNGSGQAPNGLNIAALTRDLAIVSGAPDPGPPPFVPDKATLDWLAWQKTVADYIHLAYSAGSVASAQQWQSSLNQYESGIASLLQGQPHGLPALPPEVPA